MRRRLWFTLAVVLQIAILFTMIGMKWSTLTYGTKILLKTQPVDPTDFFRGDYVILNYEIATLDLPALGVSGEEFKTNDTVFVSLVKQGKYWVARSVSRNRPGDGSLFIKGTVTYYDSYSKKLNVNYGVDSYYVPQHQGKVIETARVFMEVEVSVDKRGESAISRIFLKGQEVKFQ